MKKPAKTSPARRHATIISRRRLEMSADRWWEIYSMTFPLFVEHSLEGAVPLPDVFLKTTSEQAVAAADTALDAYEERWPGV